MADRGGGRPVPWLVGMGVLALLTTGLAIALLWWSSDLAMQAYSFYGSQGADPAPQAEYEHWERVSNNAYRMQSLVAPLLVAAFSGGLAILVVLARRWDARAARARTLAEVP